MKKLLNEKRVGGSTWGNISFFVHGEHHGYYFLDF
jgi:hypothetical protein